MIDTKKEELTILEGVKEESARAYVSRAMSIIAEHTNITVYMVKIEWEGKKRKVSVVETELDIELNYNSTKVHMTTIQTDSYIPYVCHQFTVGNVLNMINNDIREYCYYKKKDANLCATILEQIFEGGTNE